MPADHFPRMRSRFFVCMKRLLVVRIPELMPVQRAQEIAEQIRTKAANEFTVLVFGDNVEKIEIEIVYDPHFKYVEPGNYMGGKG